MKSRKYFVVMIAMVVAVTGFLGYTFKLTGSPDDWQNRGLYIDQIRPYWWPVFLSLVGLLLLAIYTSANTNDDDNRGHGRFKLS